MMNWNPNERFNLRDLYNTAREQLERSSNPMEDVLEITASPLLDKRDPRRSGKIVSDYFMFSREVVFDEFDLDPNSYNEAIFDKDLRNWQNPIKCEMKSMYSNHVWKLVETPVNVKPIGCNWSIKEKEDLMVR